MDHSASQGLYHLRLDTALFVRLLVPMNLLPDATPYPSTVGSSCNRISHALRLRARDPEWASGSLQKWACASGIRVRHGRPSSALPRCHVDRVNSFSFTGSTAPQADSPGPLGRSTLGTGSKLAETAPLPSYSAHFSAGLMWGSAWDHSCSGRALAKATCHQDSAWLGFKTYLRSGVKPIKRLGTLNHQISQEDGRIRLTSGGRPAEIQGAGALPAGGPLNLSNKHANQLSCGKDRNWTTPPVRAVAGDKLTQTGDFREHAGSSQGSNWGHQSGTEPHILESRQNLTSGSSQMQTTTRTLLTATGMLTAQFEGLQAKRNQRIERIRLASNAPVKRAGARPE